MKYINHSYSWFLLQSLIVLTLLLFFKLPLLHADSPPPVVTLENGYRISFLGVSNDFDRGISTWNYRVEELPSAQDLSVWMLELLDCHWEKDIITATPFSWWYEDPDPNMRLTGIKWQGAGVHESARFSVTLKGHWDVGTVQVSAKGPDVAHGFLAGPSCRIFIPNVPISIVPIINFLLLHKVQD